MQKEGKIIVLDYIKGFSAFYIVLHHMRDYFPLPEISKPILSFGQEAVIVFLLISGFTNFYSINKNEFNLSTYLKKRFVRIYPLLLLTFFLTWLFLSNSNIVGGGGGYNIYQLIGNILNLQCLDSTNNYSVDMWMGNLPLWSLTYIWWFYVLIGIYKKFVQDGKNLLLTFGIIAIIGVITKRIYPTVLSDILLYSFILATGSYICWCCINNEFTFKRLIRILMVYILIMITHIALNYSKFTQFDITHHFQHPYFEIRHFAAAAFLILIIYIVRKVKLTHYIEICFKPFGIIASFSYALYIIHYCFIPKLMSINIGLNQSLQIIFTLFVFFVTSYILEVLLQRNLLNYIEKKKIL